MEKEKNETTNTSPTAKEETPTKNHDCIQDRNEKPTKTLPKNPC
jgi:hypothetical protein